MNPSRSLLPAAGALLSAGCLAAMLLLPQTRATPPQEFVDLAEHCRTFTTMKAYVGIDGRSMLLHAVQDGRIAADVFGGQTRYAWDGNTLWWDSTGGEPRAREEAAPFIRDLWAECRRGFSRSTWTDVTAQRVELGGGKLRGAWRWARLDLPFAWAKGLEVYLGVTTQGLLQRVVVGSDAMGWKGTNVTEVYWNTTFPPQALDKHAPPFAPPSHPEWMHPKVEDRVVMEGENKFADIDDLLDDDD
ncbi:hypothetical protein L6R53_09820 [Myxococcota bacterium]|nr:hypothetical protein [Myxococcota bacterium]